jgi:hypothetical protein
VRANETLMAFIELERAIREQAEKLFDRVRDLMRNKALTIP